MRKNVLYYGKKEGIPERISLNAGPLSMIFEDGSIRNIRIDEYEALRSIYVAVRDKHWGTVKPLLSNLIFSIKEKSFRVKFEMNHKDREINFTWNGEITGDENGRITFEMCGEALSKFLKNRIGFCVLHPIKECCGKSCVIEHSNGSVEHTNFPQYISSHQPFTDIRTIRHKIDKSTELIVNYTGDEFEIEDQRNWTDASFKTYCTPLSLDHPTLICEGETINQTITLSINGKTSISQKKSSLNYNVNYYSKEHKLSKIGFGASSCSNLLNAKKIDLLKRLCISHLRVNVVPSKKEFANILMRAANDSTLIGAPLAIAIYFENNIELELEIFIMNINKIKPEIVSFLIFHKNEVGISSHVIEKAYKTLKKIYPNAVIGSGSNKFFAELNRNKPDNLEFYDFVCYPICPQVHGFDNFTLVENLAAQADTVFSTKNFMKDIPIHISPVTFRVVLDPNIDETNILNKKEIRTFLADERQMSLFGACWTLGSIKYLCEAEVESITYFEITGKLGIMNDHVYPMYHVFADVLEFHGGNVLTSLSIDPLKIDGIVLEKNKKIRILLANMTPDIQIIKMNIPLDFVEIRYLDETNCKYAMNHPNDYRSTTSSKIPVIKGILKLKMLPYAICKIDFEKNIKKKEVFSEKFKRNS